MRRASRFVWMTMLLMYLTIARSTAGPIRPPDGDRAEERIRTDDGTKKRQEISFDDATPSTNDLSAHKMKSVSDVLVSTTSEDNSSSIKGLNSKKNNTNKNDNVYEEYVDEEVTKSETTTKKETVYNIPSAHEIPSSNELTNFNGSIISEEENDNGIQQKIGFGKHKLSINVESQTDKVIKNETSTTKFTKEEQESSLDNNLAPNKPIDDNKSSANKTTNDFIVEVTSTSKGYTTSIEKLDLKTNNTNVAEYEEYVDEEKPVTKLETTTKKETVYNIPSAHEIPSSNESTNFNGSFISEEENDNGIQKKIEFGKHKLHTNDQSKIDKATKNEISTTKTNKEEEEFSFNNNSLPFVDDSSPYKTTSDINAAIITTTSESYSTPMGKMDSENNNNNDTAYEEFTVSDEEVTSSTTTKEITNKIQSANEIPPSYESNSLKGSLFSEKDEKQNYTLENSGLPDKTTDKNVISNETSTVTVDSTDTYYSQSINNSSDSNQVIDFVPLEDTVTDGIQRYLNGSFDWDKNDLTNASEPIKSNNSKEHEKKLQNSSNSNENKSSKNTTIYDEYVNESKEHNKKVQNLLNSDENKGSKRMDYEEYENESKEHTQKLQNSFNSSKNMDTDDKFDNESKKHKKKLQNSLISDVYKGSKNMDTNNKNDIESNEHQKEMQNSFTSDEFKGSRNMDTYNENNIQSNEHQKEMQNSFISDEFKGSRNTDPYNENDIESNEHQKEMQNSFISDEFKDSRNTDPYNENDIESNEHQKELQNSFISDEFKGSRNTDPYNENDFNPDDDWNARKSEKFAANNNMEADNRFMNNENAVDTNYNSRPEAGNPLQNLSSIRDMLKQILLNTNRNLYNMSPPDDPIGVLRYHHMQSMNGKRPNDDENPYALYVERVKSDCLRTLTSIN